MILLNEAFQEFEELRPTLRLSSCIQLCVATFSRPVSLLKVVVGAQPVPGT